MRKDYFYTSFLLCCILVTSCDIVKKLHKEQPNARLALTAMKESASTRTQSTSNLNVLLAQIDSTSQIVVTRGEIDDQGDYMATVDLDEVQVVTSVKSVAERFGEIEMNFDVIVPSLLLHQAWEVRLLPILSNPDMSRALDPIVLKGNTYAEKQAKQYSRFANYKEKLNFVDDPLDSTYINDRLYKIYLSRLHYQAKRNTFLNRKKQARKNKTADAVKERQLYFNDSLSTFWCHEISALRSPKLRCEVVSCADTLRAKRYFLRAKYFADNARKIAGLDKTFASMVTLPYPESAYRDSVVSPDESIRIQYKHVEPAGESASRYLLTLTGSVNAGSSTGYRFTSPDTLTFMVSSLTMFVDTATRYKTKVVERQMDVTYESNIQFGKGSLAVVDTLANNETELSKLKEILASLQSDDEYVLDSILMNSGSSPDGSFDLNRKLSEGRATSIIQYLSSDAETTVTSDMFKLTNSGENWDDLYALIRTDTLLDSNVRVSILEEMLSHNNHDHREHSFKVKYPAVYKYTRDTHYPKLRKVQFQFAMHRKGMVKDTVHTSVVDDVYAEGLEFMKQKKYREALSVLGEYNDFNTGLLYLCLGYNERAFDILSLQKTKTANSEYLLAILASRKGDNDRALQHYLNSVELDPAKAFRANLDPEIQKIKRLYNLDEF